MIKKKQIMIIIFLLFIVVLFFIITYKISQSHKKEHVTAEADSYESYIKKYGTGETLQYDYFIDNSGITEDHVLYIVMEIYEKNDSPKENTLRYYIKNKDIIKKIFHVLNETEYYISGNLDFRNNKLKEYPSACRLRFISDKEYSLDWFGYYTPSEDTYIFSASLFSNKNLFSGVEAQWIDKYFYYGFFAEQKIMQVLIDIIENDIKQITMEEIKEILSLKTPPVIQDFFGYLHTQTGQYHPFSENKGYDEYRLNIENYDGYLLIRNVDWADENSVHQDILNISLYDADGNLKELLYEK